MFTMQRSYENEIKINTDCLLTAVKHSLNYEADLYQNGSLIASWLGLPMEDNIQMLEKRGLKHYINNNHHCFKYSDESKNINKIYVDFNKYQWNGLEKLQLNLHDYSTSKNIEVFSSITEVINTVKENFINTNQFHIDNIIIVSFLNNDCENLEYLLYDINCNNCSLLDCKCKKCNSKKITSKGCQCQAVNGCYK